MPTYEYVCVKCQLSFSIQAKMKDPAPKQGPDCQSTDCLLQKKLSRVFGQVAGRSPAPPATPVSKPQAVSEDPIHVCSKYCDHHGKA